MSPRASKKRGVKILDNFLTVRSDLAGSAKDILLAFEMLADLFERKGVLYLAGNGGSFADAIHIAGELMKNMERVRPVDKKTAKRLGKVRGGKKLADRIETGFACVPLGMNTALMTAFLNDTAASEIMFAQELYTLGRKDDVLLALSTSGNSKNVINAAIMARARDMKVIGLTGKSGGRLKKLCDCCVCLSGSETRHVQEKHEAVYHHLCVAVEASFFAQKRK